MKRLLTIRETATRIASGTTTVYRLIDVGALERVHVGRSARITEESIDRYIESLRDAEPQRAS